MSDSLLSPYKVLDLTVEKGHFCGKILADMGADVVQIEPPGGDPARKNGSFYRDIPHPERNLYWWGFNSSKRGITLDITSREGKEIFKRLVNRKKPQVSHCLGEKSRIKKMQNRVLYAAYVAVNGHPTADLVLAERKGGLMRGNVSQKIP